MNSRFDRRAGFTLIEVLLVILILGMLAGVAIVALTGTREGAKIDTTKVLIDSVVSQLQVYHTHLEHYPTEEEGGLKALRVKPAFEDDKKGEKWRGPYLKKNPVDAWGNALNYEAGTSGDEGAPAFKLWSNGPNGTNDSGDEDDIKSWEDEAES